MEAWNMEETNSETRFFEESKENHKIRVGKEMEKQEKHSDQIQPHQPKHREWLNIFLNNRRGGEDMIFDKNTYTTERAERCMSQGEDEKVENKESNFHEQENEEENKSIVRGCIKCLQ